MSGLAFLLPVALFLGLSGLAAFFWSLKRGQFEDLDGAAMRILIDEEDVAQGRTDAKAAASGRAFGEVAEAERRI